MKKFFFLFFGLVSFLMFSAGVQALTLDAGENLIISEPILDDAYLAGGNIAVEADINGDLYLAGGSVTINGNIMEDLVVAGGRVVIMGNVAGDLRVAGGQVSVYGTVGDDVVAAGGQVDLGKSAVVEGTLLSSAGYLGVDGEIKEDIRGVAGMIFLNGTVAKNVTVTVEERLEITDKAVINGDLTYSSLVESQIPENVVKGNVHFNKFERDTSLKDMTYAFLTYKVLSYVSILLLTLIFVLLAPKFLIRSADITKKNVLKSFGIGILTIIAIIVGSIILFFTVVGMPIGLIAFVSLFIIYYLAKIFAAVWLANYVMNFSKRKKGIKWTLFWSTALAMAVYYLIGLIPFIGWLVVMVLFLIGVGGFVQTKMEYFDFLKSKKKL